jgi:hypothetical protein
MDFRTFDLWTFSDYIVRYIETDSYGLMFVQCIAVMHERFSTVGELDV